MDATRPHRPRLGIQGPVLAFPDAWAGAASDAIMRTGTGVRLASQDPAPTPHQFVACLADLGAEVYVHHVIPTAPQVTGLLRDLGDAGIDVVLGNEYGNINGPYVDGTNRFDLPSGLVREAAAAGRLVGVLYDEPEHLQIHADQYRKDVHLPHFGDTDGMSTDAAITTIDATVRSIVGEVAKSGGPDIPVLSEQVFPVLFHTLARAGMTPAPKVMKESFQPLQLSTALGAALQYGRDIWVCVDLWGPDIGPWFTRAPGFPGHPPAEFASALRMAHLFSPSTLFVENVDALVRHRGDGVFTDTEFGEVWRDFVGDFVPRHPLSWSHRDATADIALVHADDSDFGRGERPFGNRRANVPDTAQSVFAAWNLLSHGAIPSHGTCQHIAGYDFPRHRLDELPREEFPLESAVPAGTATHGLFQPVRNVLVFDEQVTDGRLGDPGLILVAGSRLPAATGAMLRSRADAGADVVVPSWLSGEWRRSELVGAGRWIVYDEIVDAREEVEAHLGPHDVWTQRFGATEVRFFPGTDGQTLEFEIASR